MAGSIELFKLAASLVLDTSGFEDGIGGARKQLRGLGGAFGGAESGVTKLSSAMNVAKTVASTAGAAIQKGFSIGKTLVESAASVEALEQSMAATFVGVEKEAEAAFAAVGEANNIATRRLQESGLGFYRQFLGAGMDSANAMMNMEDALGYAADAAAAFDMPLEDAAAAMRSFVRGNTEAGESIGVFVNDAKRNELALEKYGKKWLDLNEAERQFLLLDLVGQTYKQNNVLGQGAREANNYTNMVGNLESAWNDAMAAMGNEALPHVNAALQDITDWIKENPEVWETIGKGVGFVAEKAGAAATALLDTLGSLIAIGKEEGWRAVVDAVMGEGTVESFEAFRDKSMEVVDTIADPLAAPFNAMERLAAGETVGGMVGRMKDSDNWWEQVAYKAGKATDDFFASVGDFFTVEPKVELPMDTESVMQRALDHYNLTVAVSPRWTGVHAGGPGLVDATYYSADRTPHARGLEYVPVDGYPATLHRGESVLNRVEAADWRAAQRGGMGGVDPAALGAAVAAAMQGVTVNIDGRTAGALLTPHVSREQGREAWKRR